MQHGQHHGHHTNTPEKPDIPQGCIWAAGIALLIVFVASLGKCSAPNGGNSDASSGYNAMSESLSNSISAQDKPPLEPLSAASVKTGIAHYRLASTAEGLSGAMIYSQNCYDALAQKFSWAKLDVCGAFDMMTIRAMPDDGEPGLNKETAYFDAETAADRFLSAATSAGEPADDADARLSALQAKVAKAPAPKPKLPPPDVTTDDEPMDNITDGADGE